MACKLIPMEHFKAADVEFQARVSHENIAELYGAGALGPKCPPVHGGRRGGLGPGKLDSCGPMRTSNIVLMSDKAVLVDFGLTVQMTEDIYIPRDLRGTEMYMSPEVVLCRGHNTKTDIYSLGTTIIHMQTGSPPWVLRYPRTAYPSYLYIIHKQAPPMEDIAEDCSPGHAILS
ncbi:hypothetical protein KUCAC02_017603 [Chaenocephalus aceratus]|uniref:Uncharacterized protein n=1 Tax=Chaenocephalus aceratus TaxID=36190 RepID=A0ACB9W2C4_CHAAC|nr:hypothetical protein KUCAC02_017603 [Chaenocephalus aceratus]